MTSRSTTAQSRTRRPVRVASFVVLMMTVAGLLWPSQPAAGQAEHELPAIQPAGAPPQRSAPSADTDLWRLDDVYVLEKDCYLEVTRDEYGVFGLQTLSVACDGEEYGNTANVQGTMRISYPDQMQGGQPATFTLEANGSMQWELKDTSQSGEAVLQTEFHVVERGGLCGHLENPSQEGGATGAASLRVDELTCTYDPAVDFRGLDEVQIMYHIWPWVYLPYPSMMGATGGVYLTYKRCADPEDCEPPKIRRPVLLIPGILGSYYFSTFNHQNWVLNRGVHPDLVVIDPLTHAYDDMVQTLKNVGYVEGKDLFIVAYDWRLTPGPVDGTYDGRLEGLTGRSITDSVYQYGVDYLGYWLKQAAGAWQSDHPGKTLDSVDVITHSTGGLVARSYIQSGAYGDTFLSEGESVPLPKIEDLIMVSVPNRGASQPWQAMQNNFIVDAPSKYVIAKMLNVAYQKVRQGQTITGFPNPITPASIRNERGRFDPLLFINQYVPTFRSLLATYDFFIDDFGERGNLNLEAEYRNDLVLDLNNGLDLPDRQAPADPSPFANRVKTTVIYSDAELTAYRVQQTRRPASNARFPLDAWTEQDVPAGVTWYEDISAVLGDGTVPRESLVGQFEGDSRVSKKRILSGSTTHTGLMSNKVVQQHILDTLEAPFLESDISTGLAGKSWINIWSVTSDPVEMFLVDGAGRRLGFSEDTGPVTELPNSVWYGDADGLGWAFDSLQGPLSVEMTGLGEDYYVQVAGGQIGMSGGMEASGSLARGERRSKDVETWERGSRTYLPTILRNAIPSSIPADVWQTILQEGFEAPLSGSWEILGSHGWGRTDCRAFEGAHSVTPAAEENGGPGACAGGYPNDLNTWLIYGPFSLSDAKAAKVVFQRWQHTQRDRDTFSWMASIDNEQYYGLRSSGDTGGWDKVTFDLSDVYTLGDLRGQPRVWLGFIFKSDGAGSEEGVFIDDVRIRKKVSSAGSNGFPDGAQSWPVFAVPASFRRPSPRR